MIQTSSLIIKDYLDELDKNNISKEIFQANSILYSLIYEGKSIKPDSELFLRAIKQIRQSPILEGANIALIYNLHSEVLEVVNTQYKDIADIDCFSGEFPTYSFNAECRKTDNGYLFLINTGLIFLLKQASDIISSFCVADPVKEEGHKEWNSEKSGYSEKVIEMALTNLIIAYLILDFKVRPQMHVTPAHPVKYMISSLVWNMSVKFFLSHEFSHAICNHFENKSDSYNEAGFILKNWKDELEADRNAINILLRDSTNNKDKETKTTNEECIVCGILFSFELENLLADILRDDTIGPILSLTLNKNAPVYFTHPSSSIRQEQILRIVETEYKHINIGLGLAYVKTIRRFKDNIINSVKDFLVNSLNTTT